MLQNSKDDGDEEYYYEGEDDSDEEYFEEYFDNNHECTPKNNELNTHNNGKDKNTS